jgi:hypothetical protein
MAGFKVITEAQSVNAQFGGVAACDALITLTLFPGVCVRLIHERN